jgi:MoxR-like ATPase
MAQTAIDPQTELGSSDKAVIEELRSAYAAMRVQLEQVIVGQDEVIEQLLISIFCRSHALLVGVPGLAKTLLVSTLSDVLDLGFKRIQFTPDLMPADITGTEVLEEDIGTGKRIFKFVKGPIFANMILADEINRTPPKTQAALLEAMQEHHVTIGEETYPLPEPFFVLATQNPIEQEGTYPLPEAQLDRFMFNIRVNYPSASEEEAIIKRVTGTYKAKIEKQLTGESGAEAAERRAPRPGRRSRRHLRRADRPRDASEGGRGPRLRPRMVAGAPDRAPGST